MKTPKVKLYGAADVAEVLGVTGRQVAFLAEVHDVGQQIGGTLIFTADEVDFLKEHRRPRGRPSKPKQDAEAAPKKARKSA